MSDSNYTYRRKMKFIYSGTEFEGETRECI
jgi:hypothetical protein